MKKVSKEAVLIGVAVVAVLGFRVGARMMSDDLRSEKQQHAAQTSGFAPQVEVTIDSDGDDIGIKQFNQIQNGMTLQQVSKVFGIKGYTGEVEKYVATSRTVLKYMNKDGSSSDIDFVGGRVVGKHRVRAYDNQKAKAAEDETNSLF